MLESLALPTPEELESKHNEVIRFLNEQDKAGILLFRRQYIENLIGVLMATEIPLDKFVLFEFGAGSTDDIDQLDCQPSVRHFFKLNPIIEYHGYDPDFKKDINIKRLELLIEENPLTFDEFVIKRKNNFLRDNKRAIQKSREIYSTEILNRLLEISKSSITCSNNYSSITSLVTDTIKKEKIPVIYSSHVLTDPYKSEEIQYLSLPGLHMHQATLYEMQGMLNITRGDNDSKLYKNRFRSAFNLQDKELSTYFFTKKYWPGDMAHWWINK